MKLRASSGMSLTEYVLPLALTVVLAGSAMLLTDLPQVLRSKLSTSNQGDLAGTRLTLRAVGQLDPATLPKEYLPAYYHSNGKTFSFGNQLCMEGSYCLTIPDIPAGSVAEVDGGLGNRVIAQYATLLDSLADQMEAAGYPSNLVTKVRTMANTGHSIGAKINQLGMGIEPANPNDGTYALSDPSNPRVQLKNKIYAMSDQMNQLRLDMLRYIDANPDSTALIPEFPAIMDLASSQIVSISSGVHPYFTMNGTVIRSATGHQINGLTYRNYGSVVHTDANTICKSGQGGDACIQ